VGGVNGRWIPNRIDSEYLSLNGQLLVNWNGMAFQSLTTFSYENTTHDGCCVKVE
jgi:hypothetical protein